MFNSPVHRCLYGISPNIGTTNDSSGFTPHYDPYRKAISDYIEIRNGVKKNKDFYTSFMGKLKLPNDTIIKPIYTALMRIFQWQ